MLAATAIALGLAASSLVAPAPALASNGYVETETTTYTVNPDGRRLDVAIDIDFRNTSTIYAYSGVYVWAEHGASAVRATANAGTASVRHVRRSGSFDQYVVDFAQVNPGGTRRVHFTYRLASGAPRSSSDIRVGRAIASFCVVGQGDDGGTTTVVIPSAYKLTITSGSGSELKQVAPTGTATGSATWSTGQLGAPYAFWACLSGTNDAGYTTFTTTSPAGREIDLEAWPEDPTWKTEVQGELKTILPKLEAIVGRELPGRGPIVLREVAGSELGNYAGFYNPETG
ncbi:MAG TPA: hypothetical protein VJ506_09975, partial [Candidatus Limnocylindrales bacterium]|nr:hypothetical protein [Candidatus Limnocylindrales bacterium]